MAKFEPEISLEELMDRLQIKLSYLPTASLISNACDKIIQGKAKSKLEQEEAKLREEVIRLILYGKRDSLRQNSGESVNVGGHHICVSCSENTESGCRLWEWHGHIMICDEEKGYDTEYVYGNYFEEIAEDEPEETTENSLLRGLLDKADETNVRILCKNVQMATLFSR